MTLGLSTLAGEHNRPTNVASGEWELVPPHEQNVCQRVASATNGWVTPGNVISGIGAALTITGLLKYEKGDRTIGTALVGIGRVLDVVDGKVAKISGTRGNIGAVLDAGLDKYTTGSAAIALADTVITKQDAIIMGALQASIVQSSREIDAHGGAPDPSAVGKLAMFSTWCWMGSKMVEGAANQLGDYNTEKVFASIGKVSKVSAFALTAKNTYDYRQTARQLRAETN